MATWQGLRKMLPTLPFNYQAAGREINSELDGEGRGKHSRCVERSHTQNLCIRELRHSVTLAFCRTFGMGVAPTPGTARVSAFGNAVGHIVNMSANKEMRGIHA